MKCCAKSNLAFDTQSGRGIVRSACLVLAIWGVMAVLLPRLAASAVLAGAEQDTSPRTDTQGGFTQLPNGRRLYRPPDTPLVGLEEGAPEMFSGQIHAIGPRISTPGKERTVFTGQLTDQSGARKDAQVVFQLPGLVVLDGFRSGAPVKFDGKQVVLPMSREDEGLVESFTSDTTEGMLAAARAGAAVRLLGTDFGPRDETPGIAQPHYDIYDVPITLKIIPAAPERIKRYYFDSKSKLLARTAYTVNDVRVETRFGEWRKIDGSMYPGRVERYEGGQLVFSFIIAKVAAGPQEDGAAFKQ